MFGASLCQYIKATWPVYVSVKETILGSDNGLLSAQQLTILVSD